METTAAQQSPFPALQAGLKISSEEFTRYLKTVAWTIHRDPSLRMGQAYFNTLSNLHSEIAEDFRSGNLDPFYSDENVPGFLAFLAQEYIRVGK